jgi:transposase-like protein
VEEGGSRREAAEQFDVSVSSAIRWVQRFRENGTFEPMPSSGSHSSFGRAIQSTQPYFSGLRHGFLNRAVRFKF